MGGRGFAAAAVAAGTGCGRFAGQRRPTLLGQPDVAFDTTSVGPPISSRCSISSRRTSTVPPLAVDGRGIHHRQPRLSVASAGDKRAECQVPHQPDDDENDDQQNERGEKSTGVPQHNQGLPRYPAIALVSPELGFVSRARH